MLNRRQRRFRAGFTLLEVILATTIAVLLLGALYVAVDMQLGYAQMSRDTVEESTLERVLLARMDDDASHVVGLCDPARFRLTSSSSSNSQTGANSPTTQNASAASTTTPNTTSNTATASNTGTSSATTDASAVNNVVLPLGVMGDSETLNLFVSNLPREIYSSGLSFNANDGSDTPPVSSDLRRISYWLVGGQDSPLGLARQEVPIVTSDEALQNLPPGIDNENSFILADEVRSLNFQYWDGTEWQDSWDSTEPGPDGVTPLGSPLAIAVTIGVARSHGPGELAADSSLKTYHHVLIIPTANGVTLQTQAQSGAGGGTTQPTPTSNGSGASP